MDIKKYIIAIVLFFTGISGAFAGFEGLPFTGPYDISGNTNYYFKDINNQYFLINLTECADAGIAPEEVYCFGETRKTSYDDFYFSTNNGANSQTVYIYEVDTPPNNSGYIEYSNTGPFDTTYNTDYYFIDQNFEFFKVDYSNCETYGEISANEIFCISANRLNHNSQNQFFTQPAVFNAFIYNRVYILDPDPPPQTGGECETGSGTAIELANSIGCNSILRSTDIANGPTGSMLYVGLGATFLVAIAGLILVFVHMVKG